MAFFSTIQGLSLLAGTGVPGSRVVQVLLTLAFFALLFFASWRGYWRGPIRQLAPLASFLIAACIAYLLGAAFGHALLGLIGIPWILRGFCGSVLLCLFVWLPVFAFFWGKGKKQVSETTGEPELPVLGALGGCWSVIFCGVIVSLCLVAAGTIGEAFLLVHPSRERSFVGRIAYVSALAKNSLALYPSLSFLETWSPLPDPVFRIANKSMDVLMSKSAQQRLLEVPEIRALQTDPAVYPVLKNPEIEAMIDARDVEGLLSDERVKKMLYDENFQRKLAGLELENLLDYALKEDAAVPAESVPAGAR